MPGSMPVARFVVTSVVALVAGHLVDGWAYVHLSFPNFHTSEFGRWFRVFGFLPLWIAAALLFVLHDWPRGAPGARGPALRRGLLVLGSVAAAGLLAEVLKIVLRRERPWTHDGEYFFRPWSPDPLYTGGLALPSSHVLIAAAGCLALAKLFPRTRYVWYGFIGACAFSRVASRAHFVSDIVLATIGGVVVTSLMWKWYARKADPAAGLP